MKKTLTKLALCLSLFTTVAPATMAANVDTTTTAVVLCLPNTTLLGELCLQ